MKMLMLRKGRTRNDGTRAVVPIVRERGRKYGPILDERALSTRRDVLILGPNSAGKTRWLLRYHGKASEVWPKRPAVLLRAVNPLLSWCEQPELQAWSAQQGKPWAKLRAWERADALVSWIESTGAVVLIDDAQLLTGRKADIALQCLRAARIAVISATEEGRIPVSLRLAIQTREPQRVALQSDAPYDMTVMVVWLLTILSLGAGAWQLAAVLGGLNLLGKGRRAARQS